MSILYNKNINELFQMLTSSGNQKDASALADLLIYLDRLEEQYTAIHADIQDIKKEVQRIQNGGVRETAKKLVNQIENAAIQVRNGLGKAKGDIAERAASLTQAVKEKGTIVLNKTLEMVQCKKMVTGIKRLLEKFHETVDRKIEALSRIGEELHETAGHAKNAGRIMVGKETVEIANRNPEQGAIHRIQMGLGHVRAAIVKLIKGAERTAEKLETLGKQAEEISEKQKIAKENKQQKGELRKVKVPAR